MSDQMRGVCKHNGMIGCDVQTCWKCGWNPTVTQKRIEKLRKQRQVTKSIMVSDNTYQIDAYKLLIIAEMRKLGATQTEVELLPDEAVRNNFVKQRSPKDVAWAIMQ